MLTQLPLYRVQLVKETTVEYYDTCNYVNDSQAAANVFETVFHISKNAEEVVCMIALDVKLHICGCFEVSRGILNMSLIHPREFFKRAILANAYQIIVAHNHPSGDIRPSSYDDEFTKQLASAGELIGIPLLDHLIIGDDDVYSYLASGKLSAA